MADSLIELRQKIDAFVNERDWAQFHSPKNLAMAMIVEAAELVEHFQWDTIQESYDLSAEKRQEVVLGEIKGQGVRVTSKCLWDVAFDNYASYSYTNVYHLNI